MMHRSFPLIARNAVFAALFSCAWTNAALSQTCAMKETQELTGDLPLYYFNFFGEAMALSGDTLLIGDWGDDYSFDPKEPNPDACDNGAAYFFTRSGGVWSFAQKIQFPDCGQEFGVAVALDGDTAVIGGADGGHLYVRNNGVWEFQAMLPGASDIDGDTLICNLPSDDQEANNAGAALIFTRENNIWTQQAKLVAPDAQAWDQLGFASVLQGDTAVVSTDHSVYIFDRTGTAWNFVQELLPSTPTEFYGESISIDGDTLIVGSKFDDEHDTDAGAAYIYVRNGSLWSLEQKLLPLSAKPGWKIFGRDVAVAGDVALVCANNGIGQADNNTYVFARSGGAWTQVDELGRGPGSLDHTMVFDGSWAVVTKDYFFVDKGEEEYNPGIAYVFNIDCSPACPADLADSGGGNPDGTVDVFDLFVLLSNWSTSGTGAQLAPDTNVVDVFDLFVLLAAWGDC